ncbi:MAG: carbonic anhydrase, partial [Sediminibacterium sp.]|nr:carbonic anhydrase [Sediminibacterium sp.]
IHITKEIITPDDAITELKNGNTRFMNNTLINTDYYKQIEFSKSDQHPHSLILSCIDSRVPPEIIFDQGIGNIFVTRNAGNIEDLNLIGCIEFATKVKGIKLVVIMGHTHCGAVKAAVTDFQLGHFTQLIDQIKPAIVKKENIENTINETAIKNVKNTVEDIVHKSDVLNELVSQNKVKIIGAYYDIENGKVTFL